MFALVPTGFFLDAFADAVKAVNEVKALQNFISLEQIIEMEIASGFKG